MYTLQILDAGQTFLHTLGDQPVSFGAAEGANVRLREPGVAPIHARLEPHSQGIRVVALPDAEVLVNGQPVQRGDLRLGDRIELGRVVMIVGRTVSRAARPEDVLAQGVMVGGGSSQGTSRAPRVARKASGVSKLLPILVAVLVLSGVVFMATQGDDSAHVRGRLGDVENARATGDFDRAREEAAALRREWSQAEDDRLQKLAATEAAVAQTEACHDALLAEVLDPASTRSYAEWSRELQLLEARGNADEKVAARKLRSRLREKLRERDEHAQQLAIAANGRARAATGDAANGDTSSAMSANPGGGSGLVGANDGDSLGGTGADGNDVNGAVASGVAVVSEQTTDAKPIDRDEIERMCQGGLYAQALALVQAGFDQARDPATVRSLQAIEQGIRQRASEAMTRLLTEASTAEQEGRLQHAVTLLQMGRHHFPAGSAFAKIGDELQRLQSAVQDLDRAASLVPPTGVETAADAVKQDGGKQVDAATRLQTLESLRSHMAAVREAEDKGDFAEKANLLRQAADGVRSRDAEFADRLLVQADEAAQLAGWNDAIVMAVQAGKELVVTDRRGREVQFVGVNGQRIVARSADGEAPLDWHEIDAQSMQALAKQIKAKGAVALGLASMLYMNGDAKAAEAVLLAVAQADAQMQPQIDLLLARGRGEQGHGHSYVLRKGEFVSLRRIELEKLSKKLLTKLESAIRQKGSLKDPDSAGNQFVAATLAAGELESEALAFAMRDAFAKIEARVNAGSLFKQVEKMVVERDRLDAARRHAKDLIYDEVRYFYPYKPPAVSGERHAEYNRVQADVAERVAALRDIWNKSTAKLNVPRQLGEDLAQLDWLATQMSRLGGLPEGESIASMLAPLAWARALDPGESTTLRDFCLTPEERWQREEWRRIEAFNEATADEVSVAVRSLLKITNDYRAMFGHRPLAAVKTACAGSQGHADEMSRLGYFSHMSPVAGRRTPHDRMRLAGYMFGVSENIAMTGGALASHNAWCTSSGHHRNLLMPSHREIGIGANGRYWVQNFGSGEVYKTHPVWPTLESK